jgi:hypothetical protein
MRNLRNTAEDDLPGAPEQEFRPLPPDVVRGLKRQLGLQIQSPVHDPGHRNPPLQALNKAYQKQEAEERIVKGSMLETALSAVKGAFQMNPNTGKFRRSQSYLRPPQEG